VMQPVLLYVSIQLRKFQYNAMVQVQEHAQK
jgi:hypothetical protein